MSLISWAVDQAYIKRAEQLLRKEHDEWVRTAKIGTRYWTFAPMYAAADNVIDEAYDIHGTFVFTGHSKIFPTQLVTTLGTPSWTIWHQYGPMTSRPQQTSASWNAANAPGHAADMRAMEQAVNDAAIAELRRLYPHSVRALTNA